MFWARARWRVACARRALGRALEWAGRLTPFPRPQRGFCHTCRSRAPSTGTQGMFASSRAGARPDGRRMRERSRGIRAQSDSGTRINVPPSPTPWHPRPAGP